MNNNINPHLYDIYLHLRDTLNAKMVHRRKRKTANSIEIVFLCDAINALSGHINTLKEAEACGFWIVCRRQTGKKHAFYHGLPVFQLFLTPVHPKKALENKIQAAQQAEEITFQPISTHKRKHKIHPTPYTLHPKKRARACVCQKKVVPSTYSPLFSTGAPSNVTVASCGAYAKMGVFLPVLHTPFSVRLYAACMRAYAAYFRPQNIELHSIWQKKHPIICVCAVFVVNLQPILYSYKYTIHSTQ